MRIHWLAGGGALVLGWLAHLATMQWVALFGVIGLVFVAEMINTAVEVAVDLTTREWRLRAMLAKDVAAGAVLISVVVALATGYLLFSPYFSRVVHTIF